jgi:hypothetical protein
MLNERITPASQVNPAAGFFNRKITFWIIGEISGADAGSSRIRCAIAAPVGFLSSGVEYSVRQLVGVS